MYVKANILRHRLVGISIPSLLKDVTLWRLEFKEFIVYKNLEHFNHIDMVIRMTQYNRAGLLSVA